MKKEILLLLLTYFLQSFSPSEYKRMDFVFVMDGAVLEGRRIDLSLDVTMENRSIITYNPNCVNGFFEIDRIIMSNILTCKSVVMNIRNLESMEKFWKAYRIELSPEHFNSDFCVVYIETKRNGNYSYEIWCGENNPHLNKVVGKTRKKWKYP
jgi:hypothetical protein